MVGKTKSGSIYFVVNYTDEYGIVRKHKEEHKKWTMQEAKRKEKLFLESLEKPKIIRFHDLAMDYLDFLRATRAEATYVNNEKVYLRYLRPFWDKIELKDINIPLIEKWQLELLKKPIGARYITDIQKMFKAFLNYGVKHNQLNSNPFKCEIITKKEIKRKTYQVWTIDEFNQFISVIDDLNYEALYKTLFFTGVRIGELMGLQIQDYKKPYLTINKQLLRYGVYTQPKTVNSNRVIKLNKALCDTLDDMLSNYTPQQLSPTNWLFCGTNLIGRSGVRERKNKYCKISGVKQIRLHDFRHSQATLLLNMGFTHNDVAKRLGDNVQTIISTYGHEYSDYDDRICSKFDQIYAQKTPDIMRTE